MLLGSAATVLATLSVAAVGFLLLTGRVEVRRGAIIVLGCFMIFGAASIANGIIAAIRGDGESPAVAEAQLPPPSPQAPASQPSQGNYDPYAGAAVTPK